MLKYLTILTAFTVSFSMSAETRNLEEEFGHIANASNMISWALELPESDMRQQWLERAWIRTLPRKLGGEHEDWEDGAHHNHMRALALELMGYYLKDGNCDKALEMYWFVEPYLKLEI